MVLKFKIQTPYFYHVESYLVVACTSVQITTDVLPYSQDVDLVPKSMLGSGVTRAMACAGVRFELRWPVMY